MTQQNFDPNQYGQQPAQGMPQPVSGQAADAQSKAMLAHLSVLLTWVVTLVMWVVYKDKPGYEIVKRSAARAFNVTFTVWMAAIAAIVLPLIVIIIAYSMDNRGLAMVGVVLLVILMVIIGIWGIAALICHIIAAVKTNAGETDYKYPLPALKILKDQ